jgi:hypothetical protein
MPTRRPKNPINDIINTTSAWLGGNRGSTPSSGAGAAWQASARSAAQSANKSVVKGLGEVPVQLGALGMGTSAQVQRDVMYGVPGAGTQAAKEAAVSYVSGAAVGYGVGKVATKVVQSGRVVNPVKAVQNLVKGEKVVVHGTGRTIQGSRLVPSQVSAGAEQMQKGVVFSLNPRQSRANEAVVKQAIDYANPPYIVNDPQIVIAKTSKQNLQTFNKNIPIGKNKTTRHQSRAEYLYSEKPLDIVGKVSAVGADDKVARDLRRALRKEGVSLRSSTSIADRIAQRKIAQMRKQTPKQPRS